MMALSEYLLLGQAVVLLVTSLLLVYPVVAYARNVAYTEALVSLALAFFTVTLVGVLDFVFHATTAANVLRLLGGALALIGVWLFARDFIETEVGDRFGDFGDYVGFSGGDNGE